VTPPKLILLAFLVILNLFWMHHTVKLIDIDTEMKDHSFNPFENMGLTQPTILRSGFNTKEVKKTYRGLAKQYHPDKLRHLPDAERAKMLTHWQKIVKSYETLTDETKFRNWMEYGNPDGSMIGQTFDIALPSWVTDPENSVFVLCLFFFFCVIMPIGVILMTKLDNDPMNINRFKNGISKESQTSMQKPLWEVLEKNMKKKIKTLSDDQIITILSESSEWSGIMEESDNKIDLKPMVKTMLTGQKAGGKVAAIAAQLESILPKLTSVFIETLCDIDFMKALSVFNTSSNCKVTYQIEDMYSQFVSFIDRVMRHKQNGYKGYTVTYKQLNAEQDTGDKHYADVEVTAHGLDWAPIRNEESKEAVDSYMKALTIFVSFVNVKTNMGMVYLIDSSDKKIKDDKVT
jgi:preprotein translocase subunit Sec63